MGPVWLWLLIIPAASALGGALLGAAGPIAVAYIQGRSTNRATRNRLAVEAAIAAFNATRDDVMREGRDGVVQPLSSYLHYHHRVLELLHEGNLTADGMRSIREEQLAFMEIASKAFRDLNPTAADA